MGATRSERPQSASPERTAMKARARKITTSTMSMVPIRKALTCAVHGEFQMVEK